MLKLLIMSITNILKKLNSRDTVIPKKFLKTSKIALVLVLFVFSFFAIKKSFALMPVTTDFQAKQDAIKQGNNQESWMNEAMISNSMSLIQAIGGSIPPEVIEGTTSWNPGGMIGVSNKAIAALYTPPASGVQYIAQTFNNLLGKPAYAQGIGFQGLNGILNIWKAFRNATYALFSIFFVLIGIMIMLRVKISPQAVISIQNSIPKIVTTLILITFSYAIAGLLIDMSYLLLSLLLTIINIDGSINITKEVSDPSIFGLIFSLVSTKTLMVLSSFPTLVAQYIGLGEVLTDIIFFVGLITGNLGTVVLVGLILLIFTLIFTIKFLFGLAKCYINLILRIIIGPLEIAMGAIPNMKIGFSSWLINVIANLAVFPITVFLIILLKMIANTVDRNLWAPPLLGNIGNLLPVIFGLAGFMLVAKLPTLIPEAIFQLKPSPFGKAIGESFTSIGGGIVGIPGRAANVSKSAHQLYDDYRIIRPKAKKNPKEEVDQEQGSAPSSASGSSGGDDRSKYVNDGDGDGSNGTME